MSRPVVIGAVEVVGNHDKHCPVFFIDILEYIPADPGIVLASDGPEDDFCTLFCGI